MKPKASKSSLLGRLRSAVNKVRFILRNLAGAASSPSWSLLSLLFPARLIPFNDRRPLSLIDAVVDEPQDSSGSHASSPGRLIHRTASRAGSPAALEEEGDPEIDKKAEMFIQNFYNQLRLQKQVSLELRYIRGYTSSSSSSSSSIVSPNSYNFSVTSSPSTRL